MTTLYADRAPRFEVPGVQFTGIASPSRGSTDVCTWKIEVAGGTESAPHRLDRDEIFMITKGVLQITSDGPELGQGDSAVVPAGDPIALVNPGSDVAEAFVVIRAGFTATMADGSVIGTPPWAE